MGRGRRGEAGIGRSEVEIRLYRPGDEPAWLRCWGQVAVTSHAWGLPPYQSKPRYTTEAVELVAVDFENDVIVGFLDVEIETEPGRLGLLTHEPCGFVWEFGLLQPYRGRGHGRGLVRAAETRLREAGIRRMEFWSMDPDAQKFYSRMGMREINRHWRFWARLGSRVEIPGLPPTVRLEIAQWTASEEDWPAARAALDVVDDPPLEPHICLGFEHRF